MTLFNRIHSTILPLMSQYRANAKCFDGAGVFGCPLTLGSMVRTSVDLYLEWMSATGVPPLPAAYYEKCGGEGNFERLPYKHQAAWILMAKALGCIFWDLAMGMSNNTEEG